MDARSLKFKRTLLDLRSLNSTALKFSVCQKAQLSCPAAAANLPLEAGRPETAISAQATEQCHAGTLSARDVAETNVSPPFEAGGTSIVSSIT